MLAALRECHAALAPVEAAPASHRSPRHGCTGSLQSAARELCAPRPAAPPAAGAGAAAAAAATRRGGLSASRPIRRCGSEPAIKPAITSGLSLRPLPACVAAPSIPPPCAPAKQTASEAPAPRPPADRQRRGRVDGQTANSQQSTVNSQQPTTPRQTSRRSRTGSSAPARPGPSAPSPYSAPIEKTAGDLGLDANPTSSSHPSLPRQPCFGLGLVSNPHPSFQEFPPVK